MSLETGTMDAFASRPAALLKEDHFVPCPPLGGNRPSPNNTFVTLVLESHRKVLESHRNR